MRNPLVWFGDFMRNVTSEIMIHIITFRTRSPIPTKSLGTKSPVSLSSIDIEHVIRFTEYLVRSECDNVGILSTCVYILNAYVYLCMCEYTYMCVCVYARLYYARLYVTMYDMYDICK